MCVCVANKHGFVFQTTGEALLNRVDEVRRRRRRADSVLVRPEGNRA